MKDNPFQPATRIAAAAKTPPREVTTTTATLQKPGSHGRGRFAVRGVDVRSSARGPFLQVTLADREGEVNAISWKGAPLAPQLAQGVAVEIEKLQVDDFGPKFEPEDLRILSNSDFRSDEFVASLPTDEIERNWVEFNEFLDSIQDPALQSLRSKIWGDAATAEKYKLHPSAVRRHHNYIGGNIQHVVGIMRVVEAVCTSYPNLDRDLVIFGAAVHDLGKLHEYEVGTTIRVTEDGKMRGHLVIGAEWLGRLIAQIRAEGGQFPAATEEALVHMVLSHHGKGEWGSPKPPVTAEAQLLHLADYADSQTKGFLQESEAGAASPDGWVKYYDSSVGENRWIRARKEADA